MRPRGREKAASRALQIDTVSSDVTVLILFALAGFLLGGVYSTWKTARKLAIALAVLAVLAIAGGIAWWIGN